MEAPQKIWFQLAKQFLRKRFENVESDGSWIGRWMTLTNTLTGQWMTLTFDIHISSCTALTASTNFDIIDYNCFWKIHCVTFFQYKNIRDQIWHCCKICQGQPRVIIWTNLVVLEHPMLHTKFQGHRSLGSREDSFKVFIIWAASWQNQHQKPIGHNAHLSEQLLKLNSTF